MANCSRCGSDITGKKFCPQCGTAVARPTSTCPHCNGEITPGAAFCMHCGTSLNAPHAQMAPPPPPVNQTCPACQATIPTTTTFCTNCGHDMRTPAPQITGAQTSCASCGYTNAPGARFCNSCGAQLAGTPAPAGYTQGQYPPNTQYSQPYQQQQPYQQSPYPQPYPNYQQPMVLRCPTCMAIAPLGTPVCAGCRTSLAGIAPVPQNMPVQGQQGGFFQGDGGKLAMGALGGAAAVIGGQMLLHNLEDSFDGDHHHHHGGGVLGDLGELADDVGLI